MKKSLLTLVLVLAMVLVCATGAMAATIDADVPTDTSATLTKADALNIKYAGLENYSNDTQPALKLFVKVGSGEWDAGTALTATAVDGEEGKWDIGGATATVASTDFADKAGQNVTISWKVSSAADGDTVAYGNVRVYVKQDSANISQAVITGLGDYSFTASKGSEAAIGNVVAYHGGSNSATIAATLDSASSKAILTWTVGSEVDSSANQSATRSVATDVVTSLKVTSEDGRTEKTYSFTFNNTAPDVSVTSTDSNVEDITTTGVISIDNNPSAIVLKVGDADAKSFVITDSASTLDVNLGNGYTRTYDLYRAVLDDIDVYSSTSTNAGNKYIGTAAFKSGLNNYTIKLDGNDYGYVYVDLNNYHSTLGEVYRVYINGSNNYTNASNGYYRVDISEGAAVLEIVTDNLYDSYLSNTYVVTIMEKDYKGPELTSFNARINSSTTSADYALSFIGENNVYVMVPYYSKAVDMYYYATAHEAKVFYGSTQLNDYKKINNSSFDIKTIADNSGIERKYDVSVIKSTAANDSSTDTLSTLSAVSGAGTTSSKLKYDVAISPAFASNVTAYKAVVDKNYTHIKLSYKVSDGDSYVFINGEKQSVSNKNTTYTKTLPLEEDGTTTIEITVVAENCSDYTTYTIEVTTSAGALSTLSATNLASALTPAFDPAVLSYTAYVSSSTTATAVYAVAADLTDYVTISCISGGSGTSTSTNGVASATITLANGINIVRVNVYDIDDRTSTNYYLSIYRPYAAPTIKVSTQSIFVNGVSHNLSAYNINGNNFIKLRDLGKLLDGTSKEFYINYTTSSNLVTLNNPGTFVARGDELSTLTGMKKYTQTLQSFVYNGKYVYPMAYNITGSGDATGSNYIMVRDLASLMDFGVSYSGNTIYITTNNNYTPGL